VSVRRRDARSKFEHVPGENAMFEILDRRTSLTGNQIKILTAAIIGDALEFFDYFLIGFVLAFLIGSWKLTFGQSAVVLMSSGIGAIIGAYVWGWLADRIGRRKVFIGTVLNFSAATGLLYFTPDNGWIYLSIMRFFVGVGVGGLYCVDLPLVQEFMPLLQARLGRRYRNLRDSTWRWSRCGNGRAAGRRRLAAAVCDRRAACAARAAGAAVGAGIATLAVPPGSL
jgi:MFS family permease